MMYNKGKYVVGEIPLVFGSNLGAVVVAETFGHDTLRRVFLPDSIVSAGFFHVEGSGRVVVYGDSVGLKVKSRPKDAVLVAKAIGTFDEDHYKDLK